LAKEKGISVSELIKKSLPVRYTYADLLREYPREISQKILKSISPSQEIGIAEVDFKNGKFKYLNGKIEEFNSNKDLAGSMESVKDVLSGKYFTPDLGFKSIDAINFVDGVRIVFSNGDVSHLRPSGNAPEFRNYATADTQQRAEEIVKIGIEKILPKMRGDLK
jgi:phosphomannomutase